MTPAPSGGRASGSEEATTPPPRRGAVAANDLLDFLDLGALERRAPTFPRLPSLPPPGDTPQALACSARGPGTIPPPGSVRG